MSCIDTIVVTGQTPLPIWAGCGAPICHVRRLDQRAPARGLLVGPRRRTRHLGLLTQPKWGRGSDHWTLAIYRGRLPQSVDPDSFANSEDGLCKPVFRVCKRIWTNILRNSSPSNGQSPVTSYLGPVFRLATERSSASAASASSAKPLAEDVNKVQERPTRGWIRLLKSR